MRALSEWLEAYGESHQNPINQKIHKVAVPGIFLSVVGLIWSIPQIPLFGFNLNWVWVVALPAWIFLLPPFSKRIHYDDWLHRCVYWAHLVDGHTRLASLTDFYAAFWCALDFPVYRAQNRREETIVF